MGGSEKRQWLGLALVIAMLGAAPGYPQDAPRPEAPPDFGPPRLAPPALGEEAPPAEDPQARDTAASRAERLDRLLSRLAEPGRTDWEEVQREIERLWARSGSPAMDLLLRRAGQRMGEEEYPAAVDDLTALVELAPDFAEGWNARATAFYEMGEFSLAISDIEHVLALNPRHFGALTGLGIILDQAGQSAAGLRALREAERLNPNRPDIKDTIKRVERSLGAADL